MPARASAATAARPLSAATVSPRARSVATLLLVAALLLGALPAAVLAQTAPDEAPAGDETGELASGTDPATPPSGDVIVELEPGTDPAAAAAALGIVPTFVYDDVITGFAAAVSPAKARTLQRSPKVARISLDAPVRKATQTLPTGVDRVDADRNPQAGIDSGGGAVNADVAVLDTGIDKQRDLTVAGGFSCIEGSGFGDGDGHGTHVAGTIGARDNGIGVVGVAPGVRLWAVKVLDDRGVGTVSSVICGLEWVAERKTIEVVNMSLEGQGKDGSCANNPYHRAICRIVRNGVPVVVAAGNGGKSAANVVPATFAEAITVSAFADFDGQPGGGAPATCGVGGSDDRFAPFSNFGPDIDIAAPGVCIRSTSNKGGLRTLSGTSEAAPHVTGALALFKAANPRASVPQARAWLLTVASRPQDSAVGFTGDPDGVRERVLYLGPADAGLAPAPPPGAPVSTDPGQTPAQPTTADAGRTERRDKRDRSPVADSKPAAREAADADAPSVAIPSDRDRRRGERDGRERNQRP